MFEALFQSFEDRATAPAARRASPRCAPNSRGAGSTASSCRAPTASRTNTCRPRRAAGLAHRLHRLGRARDRAGRPRRPVRRRPLPGAGARGGRRRDLHRRASGRDSAAGLDRGQPAGRRQARLFAVAAYRRRRRAARQSLRGRGREPRPGRRQSDRCDLDRSSAAAVRRGGAHDLRYAGEDTAEQAHARARRDGKARRRHAGGHRPARGVVAVQHPRQRRSAHAGGARLRDGAEGGPAGALSSTCASSATTSGTASRSSPTCAPRREFERDLAALGGEQRTVRLDPGRLPGCDRAPRHRERRQDRARRRSDRADEGGEECGRDRRRARRAAARRRGGDALSRLVRPRGAGRAN